jgi:hypothetical protein
MDNESLTKLAVIFGAGASYDCGVHRQEEDHQCPPPLARDLFAPIYNPILSCYPRLAARTDEVRTRLAADENIEDILRELYESAKQHNNYWPFQIPLYLRHLLWSISLDYANISTKFDTFVRVVLESHFSRVMFFSLNYDLFLDQALERYEGYRLENLQSYIPKGKKWLFVKPHGAVNWARPIDNCPGDGNGAFRPSQLNTTPHFASNADITLVMWNRQSHNFYVPNSSSIEGYLYPQLVIPADNPKEFACPKSHIEEATMFLGDCSNLLLIGFSGRDKHIVQLLETLPDHSKLAIVGKGPGDAEQILNTMCLQLPQLKQKGLTLSFHNGGFSEFVANRSFLTGFTHKQSSTV